MWSGVSWLKDFTITNHKGKTANTDLLDSISSLAFFELTSQFLKGHFIM